MRVVYVVGIVVGVVLIWAAITAVCALVGQFSWNTVVPSAFNGPRLTFWQAFAGIVMLSIVGGFFRSSGGSSK
jgi:hypothetical protein